MAKPTRPCSVDGCEKPTVARQMCRSHYNRWYHFGDTDVQTSRQCAVCGEPVVRRAASGPLPKTCSDRCREANAERAAAEYVRPPKPRRIQSEKACGLCGEVFVPAKTSRQAYCSSTCGRKAAQESAPRCSEDACDRPRVSGGLCAMHHRRILRAKGLLKSEAWGDAKKDRWHKRRALKMAAATGEPVLLSEIVERDAGLCGLCLEPVDLDLAWPDPMSKSLDHVVPLSKGGAHDPSNVQLSHLRCNVRKGARVA